MTTLTMPSSPSGFRSHRFGLRSNTLAFMSPLNGTTQTLEFPGSKWGGSFTLPPMKRATAAAWLSFYAKLRGVSGRFYGFDPGARSPRGSASGSPLVDGAGQYPGNTLNTDAWPISISGLLLAGDYFQIGDELKMVTSDLNSNGSGQATITFEPPLRAAPADNAPIVYTNPTCVMRLANDDQTAWDIDSLNLYGLSFVGIEAFV
jgi:hypothetical protein